MFVIKLSTKLAVDEPKATKFAYFIAKKPFSQYKSKGGTLRKISKNMKKNFFWPILCLYVNSTILNRLVKEIGLNSSWFGLQT